MTATNSKSFPSRLAAFSWSSKPLAAAAGLLATAFTLFTPTAAAQTKIACIGEQTTHSAHREEDPEFPQRLGGVLDTDYMPGTEMEPEFKGLLSGGGTNFQVFNFGHPTGTVLDHAGTKPKTYLMSDQFQAAKASLPDIVILGPFGHHEKESGADMAQFNTDLTALTTAVQGFSSKPMVLMVTPLPLSGKDEDTVMQQVHAGTVAVATELDLTTIDLWGTFLGHQEWYRDATHLTDDGKQKQATTVAEETLKAIAARDAAMMMPDEPPVVPDPPATSDTSAPEMMVPPPVVPVAAPMVPAMTDVPTAQPSAVSEPAPVGMDPTLAGPTASDASGGCAVTPAQQKPTPAPYGALAALLGAAAFTRRYSRSRPSQPRYS